ncbi:putative transcription factor WD40-like family [Helianthus annuus]|nr:putative transcription factor WD40-like family [Helianthus annuus]
MRNFRKLESAYFSTRRRAFRPVNSNSKESVSDFSSEDQFAGRRSRWINSFLDGLCKYLSFSKLKFDRDGDFFATAGVNKKIKVFEYDSILNGNRDIHYLSSKWRVWDVTRNEVYMEMREHEKRAWSVDFSSADPTLLASGSDDGASVGTIKTKANVCSVQFPLDSGNSLAFGSADHRVYYYDLRNPSRPVCMFVGHEKTVSLRQVHRLDDPCIINFVGLSVSDGYIATGSETNEVFVYHKAFPMPALSYKFNSTDPLSGDEVDDAEQFVSSVCWRNQSSTLVAANSMGDIKLLEMV